MSKATAKTREELYELVWQKPISKLAAEFGLSDRGLSKICERYDIPTPRRGYWARVEAGQKVKRVPLPSGSTGQSPVIMLRASGRPSPEAMRPDARVAEVAEDIGVVEIPETLRGLHRVVAGWVDEHRQEQADRKRERNAHRSRWFVPDLRADLTERDFYRFRVTSAFLKVVEERGGLVKSGEIRGKLTLEACGEEIECTIIEKMIQKPTYRADQEGWTAYPEHHNNGLRTSGFLRFTINIWAPGNKELIESNKAKAGELLPAFVARILATGPALVEARKRREEVAERHRREQAERYERERLARIDAERWERFRELAGAWEECARIRAFIQALRSDQEKAAGELEGRSVSEWLDWAESKVEAMDPMGMNGVRIFEVRGSKHGR